MTIIAKIEEALTQAQGAAWGSALSCQPYPILAAELGDFATDLCIRLAGARKQTIQTCVSTVMAGLKGLPEVAVTELRGFINFQIPTEASWAVEKPHKRELVLLVAPLWKELGAAAAVRFLSFVFVRAMAAAQIGWSGKIVTVGQQNNSTVEMVWRGAEESEWFQIGKRLFDYHLCDVRPNVSELLSSCKDFASAEVWSPAVFFRDTEISGTERELARSGSILKLLHRTMLLDFECDDSLRLVRTLPQEDFFNFVAALTVPERGCSINPSLFKYTTIDSPRVFAHSLKQRLSKVFSNVSPTSDELCMSVDSEAQRITRLLKAFDSWQVYVGTSGDVVQFSLYRRELLSSLNRYLNDPRMRASLVAGAADPRALRVLGVAGRVLELC